MEPPLVLPEPELDDSFLDSPPLVGPFAETAERARAKTLPRLEKAQPAKWYELEALMPYHDLVALAGFALFVGCVALYSWRVSVGVAGAALMWLGWLMGKHA